MQTLESQLLPNVLYVILVIGLWLSALAAVTPGTGALEATALTALAIAGAGTLTVPFNPWAFLPLGAGVVFFILSLLRRQEAVWLGLSAITLSLGSAYLYQAASGGPAVHPFLATVVSLSTVGFFWLAIRRSLAAHRARRAHDRQTVIGQVGDVRTPLDPTGSVYVAGELWSARSQRPLAVGATVRVQGIDGLILDVEPIEASTPTSNTERTR
jgi:membrane-bound serine protease (ClpP class)